MIYERKFFWFLYCLETKLILGQRKVYFEKQITMKTTETTSRVSSHFVQWWRKLKWNTGRHQRPCNGASDIDYRKVFKEIYVSAFLTQKKKEEVNMYTRQKVWTASKRSEHKWTLKILPLNERSLNNNKILKYYVKKCIA